ncbi:hypothetical protein HMP09_0930 [Sphingomonas sp. HMP9]|uniref:energy transducer TonB n=1 Tax=Sphingomonas sp. HMP9 TaxID=1517554 RepID=UPI0015970DC8|nr:energy transducer TonB [Sphingomonas sp. HMP9]BCA61696.1 hypothetical protein HMP09_0930 [Sphingomonas sp. HMP9]
MRGYWAFAVLALFAGGLPAEAAPERAEPKPLSELATLFGPDAYPPAAATMQEDGMVVAALAIDPQGAVTGCRIVTSSKSMSLDAATCRIITGRTTSFSPARDAAGRPVAGSYDLKVRWVLPEAPISPLQNAAQKLTLLLSNKAAIKSCELRDLPANVAVDATTMCAGFREMFATMFGGDPAVSPPGDVEVMVLIDRIIGQAAPLSGPMPEGMTVFQDTGSEFLVQPDGTRTACTPVSTLVDASTDDADAKAVDLCEGSERFTKHQGAPIKVQDRVRVAYRLFGK